MQAKDEDEPAGYVVEKSAYYLPEVGLKPDELAMLYAAGSAALASGAFPGSQDLAHALRKIRRAPQGDRGVKLRGAAGRSFASDDELDALMSIRSA